MDKSKDGLFQICRYELVVRISLFPCPESDQLHHRENQVSRLSPSNGPNSPLCLYPCNLQQTRAARLTRP